MRATPVPVRTADELCKRLNDAFKAAGILADDALVATFKRGDSVVERIAPPLFDAEQTECLCKIVEAARR
ncbi:hypothetical protein [Streptomyces sp. WZ-12]|uniref:hypothetical protein n=1 Tax=Streptomyces sp. WZ-12 TaxID=3030210 RepID=UPI0023815396|nr:hypothetical protein [Streptomyces sp. WZ-12]